MAAAAEELGAGFEALEPQSRPFWRRNRIGSYSAGGGGQRLLVGDKSTVKDPTVRFIFVLRSFCRLEFDTVWLPQAEICPEPESIPPGSWHQFYQDYCIYSHTKASLMTSL